MAAARPLPSPARSSPLMLSGGNTPFSRPQEPSDEAAESLAGTAAHGVGPRRRTFLSRRLRHQADLAHRLSSDGAGASVVSASAEPAEAARRGRSGQRGEVQELQGDCVYRDDAAG